MLYQCTFRVTFFYLFYSKFIASFLVLTMKGRKASLVFCHQSLVKLRTSKKFVCNAALDLCVQVYIEALQNHQNSKLFLVIGPCPFRSQFFRRNQNCIFNLIAFPIFFSILDTAVLTTHSQHWGMHYCRGKQTETLIGSRRFRWWISHTPNGTADSGSDHHSTGPRI